MWLGCEKSQRPVIAPYPEAWKVTVDLSCAVFQSNPWQARIVLLRYHKQNYSPVGVRLLVVQSAARENSLLEIDMALSETSLVTIKSTHRLS